MSPGPDFVMCTRNAVLYSRKIGVMTALGLGLGVCVHVLYCIAGVAVIISQSILLFNLIKYIGAAYLGYLGFKALFSKKGAVASGVEGGENVRAPMSPLAAFRSGFLTNLLNPKATLFILSLFTQVIQPETPISVQAFFGATMVVEIVLWFSFVTFVLSIPQIKDVFLKFSRWIEKGCGTIFIALGVKLALTKAVP